MSIPTTSKHNNERRPHAVHSARVAKKEEFVDFSALKSKKSSPNIIANDSSEYVELNLKNKTIEKPLVGGQQYVDLTLVRKKCQACRKSDGVHAVLPPGSKKLVSLCQKCNLE